MHIVSNTGPVLHLAEIGAMDLLERAGSVMIPHQVDLELNHLIPDWVSVRPAWCSVCIAEPTQAASVLAWAEAGILHQGEVAAIDLSISRHADWFLTDDNAARLVARTMGLEVHGSLGVILWSAATAKVDCARAAGLLDKLTASSLWISARILSEARSALDEIFENRDEA